MIDSYLEEIGATQAVRDRVRTIRGHYAALIPDIQLTRAFISEIRDSEGFRVWQDLWLWSDAGNYLCEADNFLFEDDFDGAYFSVLNRWSIKMSEFEIGEKPSDRSRLSLSFTFGESGSVSGSLNASGENCTHLVGFFDEVLRPRILHSTG